MKLRIGVGDWSLKLVEDFAVSSSRMNLVHEGGGG